MGHLGSNPGISTKIYRIKIVIRIVRSRAIFDYSVNRIIRVEIRTKGDDIVSKGGSACINLQSPDPRNIA